MWGLAQAYKKCADLDEDKAKAFELTQVQTLAGFSFSFNSLMVHTLTAVNTGILEFPEQNLKILQNKRQQ